jgi:hypothetical protein
MDSRRVVSLSANTSTEKQIYAALRLPGFAVGILVACLFAPVLTSQASAQPQSGLAACSRLQIDVEPQLWSPGCTSGYGYQDLHWEGWGSGSAKASGSATLNDCRPTCAEGTSYVYPANLVASGLASCPTQPGRYRQYTRVVASVLYPVNNSLGETAGWHSSTFPVDASDCNASLPVFEQGVGIVLEGEPERIDARRNIYPGSISGLDVWVVHSWRRWSHRRAVGHATYWWHTPDGSDFRHYRSRLILSGLRRCGTTYVYSRIRGIFVGAQPPGLGSSIAEKAYRTEC